MPPVDALMKDPLLPSTRQTRVKRERASQKLADAVRRIVAMHGPDDVLTFRVTTRRRVEEPSS